MADEVIARLVGELGFEVEGQGLDQFKRGLDDAKKGSDSAGVAGIAYGNILADLAGAAANAALEVLGLAAAAGKDMVLGFVESGAAIDKWANAIGIGVEELQELQFAARVTAGEEGVDALNEAMVTFQENLGELARVGTGPAADSLGSLGLKLEDFDALSPAEDLELFVLAISELPDNAEELSIGMEVMGDDFKRLKPLIDLGAEGIRNMRDRARELGVVMDEETIAKAKETAVAMAEMEATVEAAGDSIGAALAPQLTMAAEATTKWIGDNQQLIQQDIPAFFEDVIEVGGRMLTWAIETGEEFQFLGQQIAFAAESIEEGLVEAYEIAEPVISFVTEVIDDQVESLGKVIAFIESFIGRLESARAIVSEIQTGLGLDDTPTTDIRGAPALSSKGKTQLRAVGSLSRSELEDALAQPGLNSKTRNEILARIPGAASKEALEAQAAASAALQLVEEGTAAIQLGIDQARAKAARKKASDKFREDELKKGKGGGGVNVREARRLLGPEIERLAEAAGLGQVAIKGALVAAANALKGGASTEVARAAAVGRIRSLAGTSAQGPDQVLASLLSKTIGAETARAATSGARFVSIDQSVNITVTVEATIPPQFQDAVSTQAQQQGLTAMIQGVIGQEYAKVADRFGPGPVGP